MAYRKTLALALLAGAAGCDFNGDPLVIHPELEETSSFEAGFDGWVPLALDLQSAAVPWEIVRSAERASDGAQSVRLRIDNRVGAGKIFIQKKIEDLAVDQLYTVDLAFDFATAEFGTGTLASILVGAAGAAPTAAGGLTPRGDTGNELAADGGYRWLTKTYSLEARANAKGELWAYVGVSGTTQSLRTYYVDKVRVTLTRKGLSAPP